MYVCVCEREREKERNDAFQASGHWVLGSTGQIPLKTAE